MFRRAVTYLIMENRRIHIAVAVRELNASIRDYSARLGVEPCCVVDDSYALWRTESLNLSISVDPAAAGTLRHLGFEDPDTPAQSAVKDVNGIEWERFTEAQQREEIRRKWPQARFPDRKSGV
jgi:hypothetical protein